MRTERHVVAEQMEKNGCGTAQRINVSTRSCLISFLPIYFYYVVLITFIMYRFLSTDVTDSFDLWPPAISGSSKSCSGYRTPLDGGPDNRKASTFVGKHRIMQDAFLF
jgi:hypothetical protein